MVYSLTKLLSLLSPFFFTLHLSPLKAGVGNRERAGVGDTVGVVVGAGEGEAVGLGLGLGVGLGVGMDGVAV